MVLYSNSALSVMCTMFFCNALAFPIVPLLSVDTVITSHHQIYRKCKMGGHSQWVEDHVLSAARGGSPSGVLPATHSVAHPLDTVHVAARACGLLAHTLAASTRLAL